MDNEHEYHPMKPGFSAELSPSEEEAISFIRAWLLYSLSALEKNKQIFDIAITVLDTPVIAIDLHQYVSKISWRHLSNIDVTFALLHALLPGEYSVDSMAWKDDAIRTAFININVRVRPNYKFRRRCD